jgi:TRAP-type C4-dicarboxylate transport system permease small subunit
VALRRLDDWVGVAETVVVATSLLLLIAVGVYQFVVSQFLETNDTWPYEVIRYSVFFIAFSGAALAAQRSKMINMDVVTRALKPKTRTMLRVATGMFAVGTCILLAKGGLDVRGTPAAAAAQYDVIPAPLGLLALPVGAALIGFHLLVHALIDISWLASGRVPPEGEQKVH